MTRLGVNIDHVATLRQARKESVPDVLAAAQAAVEAGADGITAHLREDRRHIQDADIINLKKFIPVPLNMEMAAHRDLISEAEKVKPAWACLVPEKRQELTTECGLDVQAHEKSLDETVRRLHGAGIQVSFFIDPYVPTIQLAKKLGADAVEIHTGTFARLWVTSSHAAESQKIYEAAREAKKIGLLVNAGHGISYKNVGDLVAGFEFNELNIGFAIMARAMMVGLGQAVKEMKGKMVHKICAAS